MSYTRYRVSKSVFYTAYVEDLLSLRPSILSKWRGLRGLVVQRSKPQNTMSTFRPKPSIISGGADLTSVYCGRSQKKTPCLRFCLLQGCVGARRTWPRNPDALKAGEKVSKRVFYCIHPVYSEVSKSVLHTLCSVKKCLLHPIYEISSLQLYQNGVGCGGWLD